MVAFLLVKPLNGRLNINETFRSDMKVNRKLSTDGQQLNEPSRLLLEGRWLFNEGAAFDC